MAAKTDIGVSESEYVQVDVNDSYIIALHGTLLKQRETTLRADLERVIRLKRPLFSKSVGSGLIDVCYTDSCIVAL